MTPVLEFDLPEALEAGGPPEERGIARDQVRMMVGHRSTTEIVDDLFSSLPAYLRPGDALVINTSATIAAALPAHTRGGTQIIVHFSTPLVDGRWTVELRSPAGFGSLPGPDLEPQTIMLPERGELQLISHAGGSSRLWVASVEVGGDLLSYLGDHGRPIRYRYAASSWSLDAYQNVYALEPGSSEMASAGRPITSELITSLIARGIVVVPVLLHSGVASLEAGEMPEPEPYRVSKSTAGVVNLVHATGGRVIAVGTTAVRALETVASSNGIVHAASGYTDLVIDGERPLRVVDGLVTGWHEPRASHLELVEAVAGVELAAHMYKRALDSHYLWHEFGDSSLILS